jgi:hypothetical protein
MNSYKTKQMSMSKKADISMETVIKLIIGLAVLLIVIGIFVMQSRTGNKKITDASDSATSGDLCMGSGDDYVNVCLSSCTNYDTDKYSAGTPKPTLKCLMPDQTCCKMTKKPTTPPK